MISLPLVFLLLIFCGSLVIVAYQPLIADLAWWREPASDAPPWGLGECALVVVLVGVAQFGFLRLRGSEADNREVLLLSMLAPLLAAAAAVGVVRGKGVNAIKYLGLNPAPTAGGLWIAVRAYLGFVPVFSLAMMFSFALVHGSARVFGYSLPPDAKQSVVKQLVTPEFPSGVRTALWFYAALGAPICEEILFRGLLYGALKRHLDWRWAAVVSAMIFGAVHADLLRFLPLAAMGFFLAILRERTQSLVIPMYAHAIHNTVMLAMLKFAVG